MVKIIEHLTTPSWTLKLFPFMLYVNITVISIFAHTIFLISISYFVRIVPQKWNYWIKECKALLSFLRYRAKK